MIGNKFANEITNVSRGSSQNSSGKVTEAEYVEQDKEILKERYICIHIPREKAKKHCKSKINITK